MNRVRFSPFSACAAVFFVLAVFYVLPSEAQTPEVRPYGDQPAEWAERIWLDGVPNLYRVTRNVYRSGQPTAEGFKNLEKLGIKTVVNLRAFHGDRLEGTLLKEIRIRMNALHPQEEDFVRAMRVLSDESGGPYLVHGMDGTGRTGMIIAAYRMVVQGWSREAAVDEILNGEYGHYLVWSDILSYLESLDVEKIRRLINRQNQPNIVFYKFETINIENGIGNA